MLTLVTQRTSDGTLGLTTAVVCIRIVVLCERGIIPDEGEPR